MIPTKKATPPAPSSPVTFKFEDVADNVYGHRIVLYGPGGIGKTTLSCKAPGPVAYVDAEDSLSILKNNFLAQGVPIPKVVPVKSFKTLREALKAPVWDKIKTIAIDLGRVEEWCAAFVCATVPGDKGKKCLSIEDYGWGNGYQYLFDKFLLLLNDLDQHAKAGRNIILICHDCVKNVPNPGGEDWLRYEPRLSDPKSGKGSIRLRVREWADHVLFLSYDINVDKEKTLGASGKATGSGTKTLYTAELPHFMAKSRTTCETINVEDGKDIWAEIIK